MAKNKGWSNLSDQVKHKMNSILKRKRDEAVEIMIKGIVVDYAPLFSGNMVTNTSVSTTPSMAFRFPHEENPNVYANEGSRSSIAASLVDEVESIGITQRVYIQNNTEYNGVYIDWADNRYFELGYNDGIEWLRSSSGDAEK